MEMNQEIKKSKKRFPIGLTICLAIVAVCAVVTAGAVIVKNIPSFQKTEITSVMEVADAKALREALLADAECTITITEDIVVTEELYVNGKKTLVGDKSIIMDIDNIGSGQSVCAVSDGAVLVLDGPTIDGNCVVNGVAVKVGGKLICTSGNIVYGYPYGISTAGVVEIEDVTIDRAMHTGIYAEYGGEVTMTGGTVLNNVYGVSVASGAYMSISGDATFTKTNATIVTNYGKMDITDGSFTDCFDNVITNQGELAIKGDANNKIELANSKRSAIVSKKNSKLTVENCYMHDLGLHAIDVEKDSEGDIRNCVVENTGKSSFYINNSKVYMKNVEISDVQSYAIYGTKSSNVELEDIKVDKAQNRGIVNDGANMSLKNVSVKDTKLNAIHTMGEKAVTKIENVQITTPNSNAIAAVTGGVVYAEHVTIDSPKNEGLIVNEDSKIEIEDVTITKSGMTSVANNGGTLAARKLTITDSSNIGIKTTKGGDSAVRGAEIKGTASHAIAVENDSKLTLSDCKIDKVGWGKEKSAIYISKSKLTMKDSTVNNTATYGIYIINGGDSAEKEAYLENVTVTNVGTKNTHRAIVNDNSKVALKNVTVENVSGAGIYTKGATSVTNINGAKVSETKGPGFGLVAGKVTVKNSSAKDADNDGVHVGKEAKVRLDNITIDAVAGQGIGNYGGVVDVTADKEWNTDNKDGIGATITNTGKSGVYSDGGKITVKTTSVTNAKEHAVCLKKNSDAIVNQCTFDTTEKAAVYVLESKIDLKNSKVSNAGSYGVYVAKSAKADEKGATLENITVSKAGTKAEHRGIANIDSYVVVKNSKVVASKGAGVYTSGVNAITLMNEVVAEDTGASGFALTGGEVQARNITITNTKNEGIYVGKDANVKNLDNVTIKDAGTDGIKNEGGTVHITVNKTYNPENEKENGVTIVNPGRIGIWNTGNATLTGKNVVIQDTVRQGILIDKDASVVLNNASILNVDGKEQDGINCSGTLTVNEGGLLIDNVSGHGIYVGQTGNIVKASNVTIKNAAKKGLNVYGKVTEAKNLTIVNTGEYAVQVAAGGDATILGFDISKANSAKTTSAVVYTENAKLTMKNGQINNAYASAIYVKESENCTKEKVVLENIQIKEPGKYGVYNEGSFVNVTDVTVTDSKDDGIYTKGTNAVVNMKQVEVANAGNRGIAIAGGTVVGTNLTIENAKTQSIKIGNKANLTIDSTVLTNNVEDLSDNHGILNDGGTVTVAADAKEKGLSIEGVNGCGIYNMNGSVSGKYVEINSVGTQGIYVEAGLVDLDETTVNNASGHGVSLYGESAKATFGKLAINDANKNGIYVEDGTLKSTGTITIDGKVTGNTAVTGEGLYVKGGKATIAEITVVDTKAQGLHFAKSSAGNVADVTIEGFDVSGTNLSSSNAVVYIENAKATLKNGTINAKNTREGATTYGINITESTKATEEMVVIENVIISEAGKYGVYNNGSWVEMSDVTVEKSTDDAIYVTGANAVVNMDTVDLTELSNRGLVIAGGTVIGENISITEFKNEGIKLVNGTSLSLDNATIANESKNTSSNKAGILNEGGTLTITADNQAANGATIKNVTGDGIKVNNNGKVNATNVAVMNASGCGIYNEKGGTAETPNVYKNAVIDNVGKFGVYVQAGQATLDNVDIKNVTGTDRDGIKSDAKITIVNGAKIENVASGNGLAVSTKGNVEADTLMVNQVSGNGLNVSGKVKITGAFTVQNAGKQAVWAGEGSEVEISGFNVSKTNTADTNEVIYVNNATVTLKNGTVDAANSRSGASTIGIYVEGTETEVDLEAVTVKNAGNRGLELLAGTITGNNVVIENIKNQNIHTVAGVEVSFDNVSITNNSTSASGNNHGIFNEGGTIEVTTGLTITGVKGCGIYSTGGKVSGENVTVDNVVKQGIYISAGIGEMNGLTIKNISGTDNRHGIQCGGTLKLKNNVLIENVVNYGIHITGNGVVTKFDNETAYANITVKNVNTRGVSVAGANTKLEVNDLNVVDVAGNAVYVENGTLNVFGKVSVDGKVTSQSVVTEEGLYVKTGNATIAEISVTDTIAQGLHFNSSSVNVSKFDVSNTNSGSTSVAVYVEGSDSTNKTVSLANGTVVAKKIGIMVAGNQKVSATDVIVKRDAGNTKTLVVVDGTSQFTLAQSANGVSYIGNYDSETVMSGRGVEVKGTFIMNGGTITKNKAVADGGRLDTTANGSGVYVVSGGTFTMNGGNISFNESTSQGGGVYFAGATFTLGTTTSDSSKVNIVSNKAVSDGAGVALASGTLNMYQATIGHNDVGTSSNGGRGGGVAILGGTFTQHGGIIQNNNARAGGAVIAKGGDFVMNGGTISANTVSANGGAVYLSPGYDFVMNNGTISENQANKGAAIYAQGASTTLSDIQLKAGTISNNNTLASDGKDIDSGTSTASGNESKRCTVTIFAGFNIVNDNIYNARFNVTDNR